MLKFALSVCVLFASFLVCGLAHGEIKKVGKVLLFDAPAPVAQPDGDKRPDKLLVEFALIAALEKQGQDAEAIAGYTAFATKWGTPVALYYAAAVQLRLGDKDSATKTIAKATEILNDKRTREGQTFGWNQINERRMFGLPTMLQTLAPVTELSPDFPHLNYCVLMTYSTYGYCQDSLNYLMDNEEVLSEGFHDIAVEASFSIALFNDLIVAEQMLKYMKMYMLVEGHSPLILTNLMDQRALYLSRLLGINQAEQVIEKAPLYIRLFSEEIEAERGKPLPPSFTKGCEKDAWVLLMDVIYPKAQLKVFGILAEALIATGQKDGVLEPLLTIVKRIETAYFIETEDFNAQQYMACVGGYANLSELAKKMGNDELARSYDERAREFLQKYEEAQAQNKG